MNDERPWKDPSTSLPPELRAIVDSAKLDEPAPERLEALHAKLAPLVAATPPTFAWVRVAIGTAGVAAVLAGIGGWLATRDGPAEVSTTTQPVEVESVEAAESFEASATEVDAAEASAEPAAPVNPAPGDAAPSNAPASSARAEAPRRAASGDDLGEELLLLERARASLENDPAAALRATRMHARRFPRGVLAEEREVLAIDAAWRVGERERARQRGERFLARHGRSAHAEKVRQILARP